MVGRPLSDQFRRGRQKTAAHCTHAGSGALSVDHSQPVPRGSQLIETECGRQNVTLDIALEIDSIVSVLDLVERGFGYAILSRNAIRGRPESGTLVATRIVNPGITSHAVIATSSQRPLTTLARLTIGLIKSEIAGDIFRFRDGATPARGVRPGLRKRKQPA